MVKEAVILAGGLGSRFGGRTRAMPKGFIELDGVAIVEASVKKLIGAGVERIIIGTGHCSDFYDALRDKYPAIIKTVRNDAYEATSSMGTLAVCAPLVSGDFFLLESDLIYDSIALYALSNAPNKNTVLLSGLTGSGDEVWVSSDDAGLLQKVNKDKALVGGNAGELVGVSKLSKETLGAMVDYYKSDPKLIKIDYEAVFMALRERGAPIFVKKIDSLSWAEVDDEAMLERATKKVFPVIKEKEALQATRREVLLNPGPSTTSESVKRSQVVTDICPREMEFGLLMEEIAEDLTKFVASCEEYATVFFGGSGTAADEAMVASCVPPNGKLLVVDNGSYGARLAKIASVYQIDTDVFKSSTFEAIDLGAFEEKVASGGYTTLAAVYHETTTGLLNPIGDMCRIAKKYGVTTIIDAVSAYGGMEMDLAALNIDFASATSNKHIGGMAGVGFVVCKKSELQKQKAWPMRAYYLNLFDQYKYFCETKQTRFTPPVQTLYALRQAIIETKVETIKRRFERFTACWKILVAALDDLGLRMLVERNLQSHFITAVKVPATKRYNFQAFHDAARERGFTIYPGKLGNIDTFRIANMGDITTAEMERFTKVLREYMTSIGVHRV